jgi:hypothetical protein
MTFNRPIEFSEAVQLASVKSALPTTLNSAEYRALGADIVRRAVVASKIHQAGILDQILGLTNDALAGELDPATARLQLGTIAKLLGQPLNDARLNLILDTNLQAAQGYGQAVQANAPDTVIAFPGSRLYRLEDREDPRDWEDRWRFAARAAGDVDALAALEKHGVMGALKESGIWEALGSLWNDSLGNPYPPFAFRSGMWTDDLSYEECLQLELLNPGEQAAPMKLPDFNANYEQPLALRSAALQQAILAQFGADVKFENGVLTLRAAPKSDGGGK